MGFDLVLWLKSQVKNYSLEIPLLDISNSQADDPREWLVTNGLGSYASANIWGANTRRYHGLLIAALEPPVKRTVLLSRIDERVNGEELATNFWTSGAIQPQGFHKLVGFTIYPVPTWAYQLDNGYLIKQVAMIPGRQEVVVGYSWVGAKPAAARFDLLANYRDFHGQTRGDSGWHFAQHVDAGKIIVRAFDGAQPLVIAFSDAGYQEHPDWFWNYYWPREHERGLEDHEDNFRIGYLQAVLEAGKPLTIRLGIDPEIKAGSIDEAVSIVAEHHCQLIAAAGNPRSQDLRSLIIAADSFVVERKSTNGESIIAGYHWFADWGRDSMISLPGLTLSTQRPKIARGILTTFGKYLSQGMLPNNFPDSGAQPEYNTADATFWWAWALLKYYRSTNDLDFVRQQLPLLDSVVEWHQRGTRYGLHLDADGLITGGSADTQLTWMDAKVGNYVPTPRSGKAVEINSLWFNFLKVLEFLHQAADGHGSIYAQLAAQTQTGFQKFWNQQGGCLFEVIHEDGSRDPSIRPNQLLAISLPFDLVLPDQAVSILAVVERELLTDVGLRTLSPSDPQYQGIYGGGKVVANQYDRDITYHQGTVWPWLLGAWVDARFKVHGPGVENVNFVRSKLQPIRRQILVDAGLGSISEIFDGDAPHLPRGCIAQAWSVAELLRVLTEYPKLQ